jgi:hypothetical protein
MHASRSKSVSLKCLSEVGGWQRTCGVLEVQPESLSLGPCPVNFTDVGGEEWYRVIHDVPLTFGERLMSSRAVTKNRLEIVASMSIFGHAAVFSRLDWLEASAFLQRACLSS